MTPKNDLNRRKTLLKKLLATTSSEERSIENLTSVRTLLIFHARRLASLREAAMQMSDFYEDLGDDDRCHKYYDISSFADDDYTGILEILNEKELELILKDERRRDAILAAN